MNLLQKVLRIVQVNYWEAAYTRHLQEPNMLQLIEEELKLLVTPDMLEGIKATYRKKKRDGERAVTCRFPVPHTDIWENKDGSVSFNQHFYIAWSGGQCDESNKEHTVYFSLIAQFLGMIADEKLADGNQLRRTTSDDES